MNIYELKRSQLEHIAKVREDLRKAPKLQWLFFELTNRCNLRCKHCGSNCVSDGQSLTIADVKATLNSLRSDVPTICLTGGEPMLHPDFWEIAHLVRDMGFAWGITTNATLINENTAMKLKQAGMSTVSVSLDGMEASHDALRQKKGVWQLAVNGVTALKNAGFEPQVTSVFHQDNFNDLEPLYNFLCEKGVADWRLINVEPIGRACESQNMMLTPDQFAQLISFIKAKRFDPSCHMNVTFGCSHYLGVEHERMVRDYYFFCGAGITTASIRSNGDICACLDVENIPELVQGNIKNDDFTEIWLNKFHQFRRDRTADCAKCAECSERFICGGDSYHTWDHKNKTPLLCYQDYRAALKNTNLK